MQQHSKSSTDSFYLEDSLWQKGRNTLLFAVLIAAVLCVFGFFSDRAQFSRSWLVAFCFAMTIILGGTFFVMIQYLTGSAWSVTVRRLMENIMVTVPVGLLLFVPIALNLGYLYEWTQAGVMKEPVVAAKGAYLTEQMFVLRTIIYFLVWSFVAVGIWRTSTKQDHTKSIKQMHTASRFSAPGLLIIVVTGTLASFDWIMSLDPRWYSTIFGLYCLAGGALAFFGFITLIAMGLQKAGVMRNSITPEHYHDLGKWMFALTAFWGYMAFSQYLLIWYANIPEETVFYRHRQVGTWLAFSLFVAAGRFCVPFLILIRRGAKRDLRILAFFAVWVIFMHFADMYWLIMPNFFKGGMSLSWMDFAALFAVISILGFAFWSRMKNHAIAPVGDLRFEQGLNFENV
jgi:hypothetical protein